MNDLEARVARLEAREEIRQLVADYGVAVDDRDMRLLGQIFCEDGSFGHADGTVDNQGRQAVLDFYTERLQAFGPTYHYPHSHAIWFDDDDNARGRVTAHAELSIDGETIVVALRYKDDYRREEGHWRFAARSIEILYFMRLADLPSGLAEPHRKRWPGPVMATDIPETLPTWSAFYGD